MANAEGTLVSAVQSLKNGQHTSWTPPQSNDVLWNWDIVISIKNVNYPGQTLSKSKDAYPMAVGTVVTFETDWVEAYGKYKFKKVKDKAKSESFSKGGSKKFNVPQFITATSLELAADYLAEMSNYSAPALTSDAIKNLGAAIEEYFLSNENKDLFVKKQACQIAIKTIRLNETYTPPITNNKDLIARANDFLATILAAQPKSEIAPAQSQNAGTPPPPPQGAAPQGQPNTPPPPPNGQGANIPTPPNDDVPY